MPDSAIQPGTKLRFEGIQVEPTAYGAEQIVLLFGVGDEKLRYATGKSLNEAMEEIVSTQLPMLVDDRTIGRIDSLLNGKTFYPRTRLWYDSLGNRREGEKFIPVRIENVSVATGNFPMLVSFRKEEDDKSLSAMYMSIGENGSDSRSFPTLFTIDNPRKRYSSTSDANWKLICNGQLAIGMTKEECRLSIGNPKETIAGQDRMKIIELWRYDDGRVLRFEDGLLVEFRN